MGQETDEKFFFGLLELSVQNSCNFCLTSCGSKLSHHIWLDSGPNKRRKGHNLGLLHKENQKSDKPFHQPLDLA
jgi:hypothetical protein